MPVPLTARQYREEAKRVRRIAEASTNEHIRDELFEIAKEFEALAAAAEDAAENSEPDSTARG
jgi:hypothetical protein